MRHHRIHLIPKNMFVQVNRWPHRSGVKDIMSGFGFGQTTSPKMIAEQQLHHRVCLVKPNRMIYFLFRKGQVTCWPEVKLRTALARSGHWTREVVLHIIRLGNSLRGEHIGAFSDPLAQFGRELLTKNYDKLKWPLWRHTWCHKSYLCKTKALSYTIRCNNKIMYAWNRIISSSEQNEQFQYFPIDL